jgi:alpha-tubulin suppressor-like RCC1 family protein
LEISASRSRAAILAITVVALAFRLSMLHSYQPLSPWVASLTLGDAEMGRNILAGRGWVTNAELVEKATRAQAGKNLMVDLEDLLPVDDGRPDAFADVGTAHSPGYSVWFAVSYWLGGAARYVYSQRMQAALDALACVLLFAIGRAVWSPAAGLIAAAIYALWPAPAFLANLTVAASTDSFWFIAVAYGAVTAWRQIVQGQRPVRGAIVVALAAFGGACMNSTSLVLPTVVAGVALLVALIDRRALRITGYMLIAQLLAVALLTPWALRNQRLYGQFSPVRGTFWQLAWASFGELPNPWGLGFDDKYYFNWIEENCRDCSGGGRERFTRDYILSTVVPSPGFARHVGNLIALRLPRLLQIAILPDGAFNRSDSETWRDSLSGLLHFLAALVPAIFVLAGVGLLVAASRRSAAPAVLLGMGPSIFLTIFSLLFYVELRKTMPGFGYLSVLAGIAIAEGAARAATFVRRVRADRASSGSRGTEIKPLSSPVHRRLRLRWTTIVIVAAACARPTPLWAALIAGGELHSIAVDADGIVWAWGADLYGQLGDGMQRTRYAAVDAVRVRGLTNVVAVAAGGNHSLALKADGTVWAWGDNSFGELGDGTRTVRSIPIQVAGVNHVVAISAGYLHSAALRADGTVWTWGNNLHGQLGDGTRTDRRTPVQVQGLPRVSAISAGFFHTAIVDGVGDVWSWGQNTRGQLGDGTRIGRDVPVHLSGLSLVKAVSAGQHHTLALLRAGTVVSWGGGAFGQLGQARDAAGALTEARSIDNSLGYQPQRKIAADFARGDSLRPAPVLDLTEIVEVSAGEDFSLALGRDHAVSAWGDNLYGELGDGTWDNRVKPIRVNLSGDVTAIAAGYSHAIAIRPDGSIWAWGFDHYGQLGLGRVERRVNRPAQVAAVSLKPAVPLVFGANFQSYGPSDIKWSAPLLRWQNGSLSIRGKADGPFLYVCSFLPLKAGPGNPLQTFVAQGEVRTGGVTIGVQVNEQWVFTKNIDAPGPFLVRWSPPAGGDYQVVIANFLSDGNRRNDVEIAQVGWFRADAHEDAAPRLSK